MIAWLTNFFSGNVGGIRLEYPWFLLLLLPLAALWLWDRRRPSPTIRAPWLQPFTAVAGAKRFRWSALPSPIIAVALVFLVVAATRPRQGVEELKQRAEGIDIVLALDLSPSMKSVDLPPNVTTIAQLEDAISRGKARRRIEIAKDEIRRFIEKRPNDRIGLVVFSEKPFVACPPTLDHQWLFRHLDAVDAGVIGEATGIAGPISSGVQRLKDAPAKRRVMALFTDGSNNVNARVTPIQAAKLAKNYNIVIYTIGIGSDNAVIEGPSMTGDTVWHPYSGEFDKELLGEIAKESDGKYFAAADAKGLKAVMNEIDRLEKTSVEQPRFVDYRELGPEIASIGLLLLALAFVAEKALFPRLP